MFRNFGSFNLPSVSSQYGDTKAIKMNTNATAANIVATKPVLDFPPMFVYYSDCIRVLMAGGSIPIPITAATIHK
jgi:hypothetical protein